MREKVTQKAPTTAGTVRGRDTRKGCFRMRYETSSPLRYPTARGGVCVVEGYGVRLYVRHGRLHVCDGYGRNRRERVYARVNVGISRLIVLGHAGSISLEALRWLADLGIAFAQLDLDGPPLP